MHRTMLILAMAAVLTSSCQRQNQATVGESGGRKMEIKVTSRAFDEGETIPEKYTCDGQNVSPPLSWTQVPEGTKSVSLISDDPDAPMGTWVHWVLFDLPPDTRGLPEHVRPDRVLPNVAKQGSNDAGRIGYTGPCPPSGTHRYFFKVYALDTEVALDPGAKKADLVKAMEGHILAQGQLMGRYSRR